MILLIGMSIIIINNQERYEILKQENYAKEKQIKNLNSTLQESKQSKKIIDKKLEQVIKEKIEQQENIEILESIREELTKEVEKLRDENCDIKSNTLQDTISVDESNVTETIVWAGGQVIASYENDKYNIINNGDNVDKNVDGDYEIYLPDTFNKVYYRNELVNGELKINKDYEEQNYIAIKRNWLLEKKQVEDIVQGFNNSEVIKKIEDLLLEHGIENSPVVIKQAFRCDINNDNVQDYVINACNIVDKQSEVTQNKLNDLLYSDKVGYYNIFMCVINDKTYIMSEEYEPIKNNGTYGYSFVERQLRTINEYSEAVLLYSKHGQLGIFCTQTDDEWAITEGYISIINITDLDNDGNLEIILKYKRCYGGYGIYDFNQESDCFMEYFSGYWYI